MKLAPILTQYLSHNKRLDLPGIGSFLLDPLTIPEPENQKRRRSPNLVGVTFESDPSIKDSNDLIEFISGQTGKMKALAAADLRSHLELAEQFLNIGKPFLFEGIGSLVKLRSGQFVFTSGQVMPEKMKEYSAREISNTSSTEDSFTNYKNVFKPGTGITKWRRPVLVLFTLAGVGFAIWAGYTVYKTTTKRKESEITGLKPEGLSPEVQDSSVIKKDSIQFRKDSVMLPRQQVANGAYKFIIEIANAKRASVRYARLKSFQWNIHMETKDSLAYKLYLLLPIPSADTTRVLDSLTVLSGKRVYIEN